MTFSIQHVTVPLSKQVSGDIDLTGAELVGIFAPTVTSCDLRFQGNYDTTSANFLRMADVDGGADWVWALGTGSKGTVVTDVAHVVPFARLELSVPQAALRSLAIVSMR